MTLDMTLRFPFRFFSDEDAMEDDFFSLGRDFSSDDEDEDDYDEDDDDDYDFEDDDDDDDM